MEIMLRCLNTHEDKLPHDFILTAPPKRCPKCGNTHLVPLVRIFLIVEDPKGPIQGAMGRRYSCPSDRTKKEFIPHVEACTGEFQAVNNPACMRTKEYAKLRDEWEMLQMHLSGGFFTPTALQEETAAI